MKIKKITLFAVSALLAASLISFFIHNSRQSAHHRLDTARQLLGLNKPEGALTLFRSLEGSVWVSEPARLGTFIAGLAANHAGNRPTLPEKIDIYAYYLPEVLDHLLASAAFDRCRQAAELGRFYKAPIADLYYAAALLETGEMEHATDIFNKLPDHLRYAPLGRKVQEALLLVQSGAQKIVRFKKGEILGFINRDEQFVFYSEEYRMYIQPVVIRNILTRSGRGGLRVSIDLELSRIARTALAESRGSIVLVDPGSGQIRAAVSNGRTKYETDPSPAFEQMLEPASIMKLLTVTAAFRDNLLVEEEISSIFCWGGHKFNGKTLWCPARGGHLKGLDHAMSISCNTAFAALGVKLGWPKMVSELHLFGFDSQVGNPFSLGRIIIPAGDDRSLADLSIGLENTVISPVHGALIASVFANNGYKVEPQLFAAYDGFTGLSPLRMKPENIKGDKIISSLWLPAIREAMWAVTRYGGTAGFIAPVGYPVHMKTGTGGNYGKGFHINYIGYGPADSEEDRIAFCVRVTGGRTSYRVRRAGYGVNQALLYHLKLLREKRTH